MKSVTMIEERRDWTCAFFILLRERPLNKQGAGGIFLKKFPGPG